MARIAALVLAALLPLCGLAAEVAGVKLADKVRIDAAGPDLVLNGAGLRTDDIRIALGSGIAARYQRQKQGKEAWRLVRGGIGVNVPAPEPDSGMMLHVNMKTLDVDSWITAGSEIAGSGAADRRRICCGTTNPRCWSAITCSRAAFS